MAKQKKPDDLNLDLSDLFSEAEKAIETISTPKFNEEEISFEIEIDESSEILVMDAPHKTQASANEIDIDLDAELAALEGDPQPRSELDILKEELTKAKKIIRLQKVRLGSTPKTPAVDEGQLTSLQKEIVHLKERVKEGHKAQLESSKKIHSLQDSLQEEKERSSQLRSSYSSIRSKAEEFKQAAEQLKTRLKRVQERRKKESEENKSFGGVPALKAIIPTIENLERALQFPNVEKESLLEGIQLTLEQLTLSLSKVGMTRVETKKGVEFDPNVHEAIQRTTDPDVAEGCIVQEIAAGFTLNGRLLRAAKVAVSIASETGAAEEASVVENPDAEIQNTEESILAENETVHSLDTSTEKSESSE